MPTLVLDNTLMQAPPVRSLRLVLDEEPPKPGGIAEAAAYGFAKKVTAIPRAAGEMLKRDFDVTIPGLVQIKHKAGPPEKTIPQIRTERLKKNWDKLTLEQRIKEQTAIEEVSAFLKDEEGKQKAETLRRQLTMAKRPIASGAGEVGGGLFNLSALTAAGMPPNAAFATTSGADEAVREIETKEKLSLKKIGLATGAGYITGKVFQAADLKPGLAKTAEGALKVVAKPTKTVLGRAARTAVGAASTAFTENLAQDALSGQEPDIKKAAQNALISGATAGIFKAIYELPELRGSIYEEANKHVGKPSLDPNAKPGERYQKPKDIKEAKKIVTEVTQTNPEELSPNFIKAKNKVKADNVIKNIDEYIAKTGLEKEKAIKLIREKDFNIRLNLIDDQIGREINIATGNKQKFDWKWGLGIDYSKMPPESVKKIQALIDFRTWIANGVDPAEVLMLLKLQEEITPKTKVEQTVKEAEKSVKGSVLDNAIAKEASGRPLSIEESAALKEVKARRAQAKATMPAGMALRLKDGTVVVDPTAKIHADITINKGIDPDNVQDVGWVDPGGVYTATKKPDTQGGEIIQENLPKVPEAEIQKAKDLVKAPEDQFNTEIIAAAQKITKPGETLEENIARTKDWISSTLTNDEASTDQEMIDYFQKEGGFSKEVAEYIVSKRGQVKALPLGVKKEMKQPTGERKVIDVQRYSSSATLDTSSQRGGTWYQIKGGKTNFENFREVGGKIKTEKQITVNNPLKISYKDEGRVEDFNLGDGSYNVVLERPETLPKIELETAKKLFKSYNKLNQDSLETKKNIGEMLRDYGMPLSKINDTLRNPNYFDAAIDQVVGIGLKKNGYDSLILEDGTDTHIFQLSTPTEGKKGIKKKAKPVYVDVNLSEEDKTIIAQIRRDTEGAQPGYKYVTRDPDTGEVTRAGYEPSDYELLGYLPKGYNKANMEKIYANAEKNGKLTEKQKADLDSVLFAYKESINEKNRLEKEGFSGAEIEEAIAVGNEDRDKLIQAVLAEVKGLSTDEIEKLIDARYEAGAPQDELDLLETLYDERVSDEEQNITEDEVSISEETHQGAGLEEQLIQMYHRYLNPDQRNGMEVADIIGNMRSAIETAGFGQGGAKRDITDEQILSAAKEVYDKKQELLNKQRSKDKEFPTEDLLKSPKFTEVELYQKYLKEAKDLKYSDLGAKQYADKKIKEYLANKPKKEKTPADEQIKFQGGVQGFGTQEKGQEELFGKEQSGLQKLGSEIKRLAIKLWDTDKPSADDVRQLQSIRQVFAIQFYQAYKEKYGEYPIAFINISDRGLDYESKPGVPMSGEVYSLDFGQSEKDRENFEIFTSIDEALDFMHKRQNRGKSSEIIQSDIQYYVEGTRPIEKKERPKGGSGSGLGSTGGEESIEEAQVTEKDEVNKGEFKLYKEIQALVDKYARLFGEKYQGRKRVGVFYPDTKNIFLKTVNNIGTAAHEVLHYLDDKFGITEAVTLKTGEASNGNPIYDSATKPERKLLTDIYLKYYPTAKPFHKLKKRVEEGMAVLIQRYITNKENVVEEYPELVNMFFKEDGKYYDPTVNAFVKEAQDIIRRYKQLDPLQKIGSIVMSDSRPVVKDSYLNVKEKILTEIFDNLYPLEKLGKEAGKGGTTGDPALWVRLYNNSNAMVINNLISDNRGYWTVKDGAPAKLYDFNWKTVVRKLTDIRSFEDFGNWLVARDTKFNYDLLDKLKDEAKQAAEFIKELTKEDLLGGNARNDIAEAKRKIAEYQELSSVLANNKISREVANAAYDQHKERFAEVADMFDKLVRADLDLLYETGMITNRHYEELTSKIGYATLKRDVYNELLGTPTTDMPVTKMRVGRNKVSSMMSRHGSQLTIINPLYSSMLNHAEIVKKALRQIVYNKIYDLKDKFPDLFQKIDLVKSMDKFGRFSYPQERDPNIIMAWSGGRRYPVLVSKEIKTVLDECLTYQNLHLFEKILIGANKLFTKGTTGLFLPFTLSNFVVDQTTAVAQTNERLKPIFDPLKTMMIALEAKFAGFDSADTKFLEEYLVLGGSRQTLVGWQDMSADDMYRLLNFEKHYLNRAIDTINTVEDFVAFLPKWSEILTRASEYIKARKAGKDIIVAMEEAGRVTAPFHHRGRLGGGTTGRTFIQSLPFFNASLQVLAQYGRTLHNPKTRNRALLVVLAIMATSISSLAYLLTKGTKKQKEAYQAIPVTELAMFVYFPAPNGVDLIRIRVPEQMNVIPTLMNMAIANEMLDAKYDGPEFMNAMTAWLPDQLNITDPARQLTSLIPQLAAPIIGVTLNKKFYPQVRPLENMSMENLPVSERYTDYTSSVAKFLGKEFNLSPVKIDFLIQGYLGRYTKFITGQKISNPFIREMYMSGSRQIQKYYDMAENNKLDYSAINKHTKEFTSDEYGKIVQIHNQIAGINSLLERYRKIEKLDKEDPNLQDLRDQIFERIGVL